MSATYAQMQQRVGERLGDPTGGRTLKLAQDAIREAVVELDTQVWPQSLTEENITLILGQREYTPSATFRAHAFSWLLNSAQTRVEKPIPFLTPLVFDRSGYEKNDFVGLPIYVTYMEDTGKYVFDREPGADEVGRVVRMAYYTTICSNPPTTVDDALGDLIVEVATWRARRVAAPGTYDWQSDKAVADAAKLRLRSRMRSIDLWANAKK